MVEEEKEEFVLIMVISNRYGEILLQGPEKKFPSDDLWSLHTSSRSHVKNEGILFFTLLMGKHKE